MSRNCLRGVIAIATFLCLMQVGAFAQLPPPTVSASALAGTPVQNRDAIQTILNANVGNTIVLPSGTFLIAPVTDKSKFLTLPAGTILRGSATLKVADNSAPYTSVFYSADCSGCDIRDFTIDANVANNPGVSFQVLQNESPRHEFEIWAGTDVLFQGITVKNSTSIQAILISGALGGTVQNVTVKDNSFVAMGDDPDHIIHDTSTVFVWGNGVKISGNYFSAASIGAPAAYTAIETHGSNFTISNNVSFNYVNGFNICGQNSSSLMANGVTVIGNSVSGALYGVSLYTGGVTVTGNSLRLNQTSYVSAIWGDYRESYGVSIVDDIPYTVSDVVIAHNTITFDAEASDRDVNTSSKGIGWISSLTPTWGIVNVSVSGNIIDNAPLSAIRFSVASAMGLKIANNIIRNAGQSLHAVSQGYKTPIFLYSWSGPMVGDVTGNTIIDDQATSRMVNAFLLGSAVTGHDLQLRDNSVSLLGTNTSSFASYITFLDGNVVPSLREIWANFALTTTQPVARGSRVIDPL